jgi:hypothetical protein
MPALSKMKVIGQRDQKSSPVTTGQSSRINLSSEPVASSQPTTRDHGNVSSAHFHDSVNSKDNKRNQPGVVDLLKLDRKKWESEKEKQRGDGPRKPEVSRQSG